MNFFFAVMNFTECGFFFSVEKGVVVSNTMEGIAFIESFF